MSAYTRVYKHLVHTSCRFAEIIRLRRAMIDEQWTRQTWCNSAK